MPHYAWLGANVALLLFVLSVVVKHNDRDPSRWMLIYGLAAVACGLARAGAGFGNNPSPFFTFQPRVTSLANMS